MGIEQMLEIEIAEGQQSEIKRLQHMKGSQFPVDFIMSDHMKATVKFMCDYILELARDSSNVITPNFMVDEMKKKYGIIISYNKGWRAIQHVYMVIRRTPEEHYTGCHRIFT
ncbi:hypothetical protein P3L10_015080 [Capsicum annuum]